MNLPRNFLAGEPGFEPRLTESESVVLPLNYSPTAARCGVDDAVRASFAVLFWCDRLIASWAPSSIFALSIKRENRDGILNIVFGLLAELLPQASSCCVGGSAAEPGTNVDGYVLCRHQSLKLHRRRADPARWICPLNLGRSRSRLHRLRAGRTVRFQAGPKKNLAI